MYFFVNTSTMITVEIADPWNHKHDKHVEDLCGCMLGGFQVFVNTVVDTKHRPILVSNRVSVDVISMHISMISELIDWLASDGWCLAAEAGCGDAACCRLGEANTGDVHVTSAAAQVQQHQQRRILHLTRLIEQVGYQSFIIVFI